MVVRTVKHLLKSALNRPLELAIRRLPARARVRLIYLKRHRRWPDLSRPSRFSEFCQTIKFSGSELAPFVDKIAVKDFVRQTIGDEYLIPTYYAGDQLPPLEERTWPVPFIIKTSHTSGGNIFVTDVPDWPRIERDLEGWLAVNYADVADERFYSAIQPRLLVEPIIGQNLVDYKFYTFGGVPRFIQVDTDREFDHKRTFFDCSWNRLGIARKYPPDQSDIERPANLNKMIDIASSLGRNFPFVRVDLYEVRGKVYFGELTFSPGAGYELYRPADIELQWGRLWLDALVHHSHPGSCL